MKKQLLSNREIAANRYLSNLVINGWIIYRINGAICPEKAGYCPEFGESHTLNVMQVNHE